MQDAAGNLVGVALGIRATILEVAFVAAVDEAVWNAHRGSAVGNAVVEFVDRLGFVEASETEMVVWPVNGDVLVFVFIKRGHEFLEVILPANFAQVFGGKIRMHAGAVPIEILAERFAVVVHIHAVLLAEALEEVAGDPHFVSGAFGAFAEDLEFPLAFGDFGVDAFVVDAGVQAEVEMFFHDLAGDVADGVVADAGVVEALRGGVAFGGEAKRAAVLVEKIFLLEAKPRVWIVQNGSAGIRGVRSAIRQHDFAHDERAVFAGGVREDGDRLEKAIRAVALGLACRAAVKAPHGEILELGKAGEFFDGGLAAEVGNGLVAVEPDVFEFVFSHYVCGVDF